MNAAFAFCAMVMVGSGTADFLQPISPSPENARPLPSPPLPSASMPSPPSQHPHLTGARQVHVMNQSIAHPLKMPIAPTDPGAFARNDLPQPPMQNYNATSPGTGWAGMAPRHDTASPTENGRRSSTQKPFDHYSTTPAVSPYTLLDANTNNGTVNTYSAYVRPLQEQERANHELSYEQNANNQPAPTYPPCFLNNGPYYPNYGAAR